jgi:hypothetical protein
MSDVFGPASLAAGQALSSFAVFLPRLTDVRKADPGDPGMHGDVRLGEVAACAVSIGIGVIASSLSGSPIPMYAAAFISVILIVVYEAALNGNDILSPKGVTDAS